MSRLFGHGDLRLWLLKLLDEKPRHGYEMIAGLEEQFLGLYSPSPGTVYPRLQALEQEGLIEVVAEEEGRKVYSLTDAGKAELVERAEELRELATRLTRSARDIASDIREDVKSSVQSIRREIMDAAREVRRDARRESRSARLGERELREARQESRRRYRAAREAVREVSGELRSVLRSLQSDLDGFVADVLSAARQRELDKTRLASLKDVLRDARTSVLEALDGELPKDEPRDEDSAQGTA